MAVRDWMDNECQYLAELVKKGSDSPRVPASSVGSYLEAQHSSARKARRPDVCEFITLLGMYRENPDPATWAEIERLLAAEPAPLSLPGRSAHRSYV